jgi:4-diphosphocytidyl-2-C-methyl-D-erythritol kinase
MKKMIIKAPAKINFGLNVVEKRKDGYHNIETIFYPINLFDKLTFIKQDSFALFSNSNILKREKSNLIIKAKELLEKKSKQKLNCEVHLEKNIPIGAGMGGGSSDAAAALLTLNKLFELNFSIPDLYPLALSLGSDVPFFLNPQPSFAVSRGEILTPISLKINHPILIVNPKIHISTSWAYKKITPKVPMYSLSNLDGVLTDTKAWKDLVNNDFEKPVFEEHPELKEIKENLYKMGALFALMTGSGSSFFAVFENTGLLEGAKKHFNAEGYFTFAC